MKILISGATGFIGSHLIDRLQKQGHSVHAIVRPTTNTEQLTKKNVTVFSFDTNIQELISYLEREHFNGIIHLASLFLAQHKSEDISNLINSNVLFSNQLLEAAVKTNTPWFINTGTFWQHYKNKKYSPVNLYAATKQAFEDIAQYYLETSPINFVTIKLSDTFGPGDPRPKVFNLWLKISQSQESLDMSPGKQLIDISFIDNVIDGYIQLIELLESKKAKQIRGKYFAIKSKQRMPLRKLAQVFEKVTQTKLNINWGKREYRLREVMIPWSTGKTIPGWKPKVTLEEGIQKTFKQ